MVAYFKYLWVKTLLLDITGYHHWFIMGSSSSMTSLKIRPLDEACGEPPQFRRPSPAEPYAQRGVLWAMARYSPWTDSQRLALGAQGNHWDGEWDEILGEWDDMGWNQRDLEDSLYTFVWMVIYDDLCIFMLFFVHFDQTRPSVTADGTLHMSWTRYNARLVAWKRVLCRLLHLLAQQLGLGEAHQGRSKKRVWQWAIGWRIESNSLNLLFESLSSCI